MLFIPPPKTAIDNPREGPRATALVVPSNIPTNSAPSSQPARRGVVPGTTDTTFTDLDVRYYRKVLLTMPTKLQKFSMLPKFLIL